VNLAAERAASLERQRRRAIEARACWLLGHGLWGATREQLRGYASERWTELEDLDEILDAAAQLQEASRALAMRPAPAEHPPEEVPRPHQVELVRDIRDLVETLNWAIQPAYAHGLDVRGAWQPGEAAPPWLDVWCYAPVIPPEDV
jgi:hypothetical protein